MTPTPTSAQRPLRYAEFPTLLDALDAAAEHETGINLHGLRGELLEVLTYRALREQALTLAGRLLAAGLEPGERVALPASSDGDFIRAFFACQYAGLTPAPLPLPAPFGGREAYVAHLERMLERADAAATLCGPELAPWFAEAAAGKPMKFQGPLADLPQVGSADLPRPDPEGLSYLQFSSGSTRAPMGVAVTHKALMANAHAVSKHGLKVEAYDRAVSWLPLYHDMGLVGFLLMPLSVQMSLDLLPTASFVRRPRLWLDLIGKNRGTISYAPTFGYDLAARRADAAFLEGLDLSTWRSAGIGGDMIRRGPLDAFAETFAPVGFSGGAFVASYGMAEATLALSMAPLGRGLKTERLDLDRLEREQVADAPAPGARSREFALCGPALPGHALQVRGEDGETLAERRIGRVFARGPSLMKAYYGQPEETRRVLSPDGWLDTGDLGYVQDGQIVLTGRAKDLIIVHGRNVWPQDLEWTAEAAVPTLRSGDVAVFSAPAEHEGEETVVALVQVRSADPAVRQALCTELSGVLRARHGLDVQVVAVPPHALPQTSSGKLSRARAKALYLSGAFKRAPQPV